MERALIAGGRGGTRTWHPVLVLLAYVGVTVVLAGPFLNYSHFASSIYVGDARLILWTLAWDSHAILHRLPLFQANVFYPAADGLAYNEHLFGVALFYLPFYAATNNPVLAHNILEFAAWVLNAFAAYRLAYRYLRDHLAAFVGGLVFAFSFFRMLHGHSHLGLAWTFWIPLSLLAMERWYRAPGWRRLAWLTLTIALQVLANWYLAAMTLVANGVFLACLVLLDRDGTAKERAAGWRGLAGRRPVQMAAGLVILFLAVWPFASHYRNLPPADSRELQRYSADAIAYLMPAEHTWVGQRLLQAGMRGPRWTWGETTLYLGAVALACAAVGAVGVFARRRTRHGFDLPPSARAFFPLLAVLAVALSLGPSIAHVPAWCTPFVWFNHLPGAGGFRAPARFALLVVLAVAMLAAAGAALLHRRFGNAGRVMTVLLVPLMLSEWYVIGFQSGKPQPEAINPVYRRLARLPARGVVSVPIAPRDQWPLEADYLYYSTAHWHPIVNGFGRSEPPDHFWISGHMRAFAGHNSARTMRRFGIDYVVLHADRLPEGPGMLEQALQNRDDFRFVVQSGSVYLFQVLPARPGD